MRCAKFEVNMDKSYYIFKSGTISRKDNTIRITSDEEEVKDIPVETTSDIYLFSEINLNTKLLNYCSQHNIMLHVFNYYGFYSGSFVPRERNVSGFLLVNQVEHYTDNEKRLYLAKKFVEGASQNIYRNLRYYYSRNVDLKMEMDDINSLIRDINSKEDVLEVMGIEGNIRKIYYETWNKIIKQDIDFTKRVKRPPDNMINSLLSFVNTLTYTTVLSEIYKTQLNPTVSFLHEPSTKRYSLSLDVAEIFKPLIAERMIFSMLNKNQITEKDFETNSNFLALKENASKKILAEYDERLKRTIRHKELNRDVSYRYLIRLECYKLIKHLIGEKPYEPFVMWW